MGADVFDDIHHIFSMAMVADKMSLFAYGIGRVLLTAKDAGFLSLRFQIDQWLTAQHAVLLELGSRLRELV